jgi:hypothetical protein
MLAFLAEWGVELILGIIAAGITGGFTWYINKLKKQLKIADEYTKAQGEKKVEASIEEKTKPIYDELENLRSYVRDNEIKSDRMWTLVIDSYKFRLTELCKHYLAEGEMTQSQFDQLSEFYNLYTSLGGNGQAKQYYDKASALPIHN